MREADHREFRYPIHMLCVFVAATVLPGCGGASSAPAEREEASSTVGAAAMASEQKGKVIGGVIRRDAGTQRDIEASSEVFLDGLEASRLSLVVTKSRYRLDVMRGEKSLKTFPVALGDAPVGPKRRQGDERTPEGEYVLVPHHPSPSFGVCFYVCYPNEADADRALDEAAIGRSAHRRILERLAQGGRPPHDTVLGGLILLHGTKRGFPGQTSANWTDGCIAMNNDDLAELLALYRPADRPTLTIRP
jgi:hypothetical protein